jgi:hypothetical protein
VDRISPGHCGLDIQKKHKLLTEGLGERSNCRFGYRKWYLTSADAEKMDIVARQ